MKYAKNAALNGYLLGLLGVIAFGGTLPATRILAATIDPVAITLARGYVALVSQLLAFPPWPLCHFRTGRDAVPRSSFQKTLGLIDDPRRTPVPA
jgi:drug/metabolite transporter (DMT)-like permease